MNPLKLIRMPLEVCELTDELRIKLELDETTPEKFDVNIIWIFGFV